MPNLEFEQEQLVVADRHIALARKNIAHLAAGLARARDAGDEISLPERALAAAEDGLAVFLEHRALIATTIEDILAGRLPRS